MPESVLHEPARCFPWPHAQTRGYKLAIKAMYDRNLSWFLATYDCCAAAPIEGIPILGCSSIWPCESGPRLICAGPCLDHALPDGPSHVSFQMAIETAIWFRHAKRLSCPLFLFIMGSCSPGDETMSAWNELAASYGAFVDRVALLIGHDRNAIHLEPSWLRDDYWEQLRNRYPIDAMSPLFQTMYRPEQPTEDLPTKTISPTLVKSYHNNLLAYHPELIGGLSPWDFVRVQHLENLQQVRAFYTAAKLFGLDPQRNAQTVFLPIPSPQFTIRMTRAQGVDRLPAYLGKDEILRRIEESQELSTLLASMFDHQSFAQLVEVFAECFDANNP